MVDLWKLGAAVYAFAVLIWLVESIEDVDSQGVVLLSGLLGILIMIVGSILTSQSRREK